MREYGRVAQVAHQEKPPIQWQDRGWRLKLNAMGGVSAKPEIFMMSNFRETRHMKLQDLPCKTCILHDLIRVGNGLNFQ